MRRKDDTDILEHYRRLSDDELLRLSEQRSELLADAQPALDLEVRRRKQRLDILRKEQAEARESHDAWRTSDQSTEARLLQWQDRLYRWIVIFITPFVPFIVISELRAPSPNVVLIVVLTGFVVVFWFLTISKWKRSKGQKAVRRGA